MQGPNTVSLRMGPKDARRRFCQLCTPARMATSSRTSTLADNHIYFGAFMCSMNEFDRDVALLSDHSVQIALLPYRFFFALSVFSYLACIKEHLGSRVFACN